MNDNKILSKATAGSEVAENETSGLKNYFLKTYLWDQIIEDDIDIVFGCKGSGKSALYSYLSEYSYDLIGENTILVPSVNPRGTVAFKDLQTKPPTNEIEFNYIWKLYFVLIIAQKLTEFKYKDSNYKLVIEKLQESDLLPRSFTFPAMLRMVRDYIFKIKPSIEPNVTLGDSGQLDRIGCKICLSEPSTKEADRGMVSIDYLFELINKSLTENDNSVWLSIDRLDVVFVDSLELEVNALRALFKVYIDLMAYDKIRLIVFLRDDIWNRIIEKGFRELSHITRVDNIQWNDESLFVLIISRLLENEKILEYFQMDRIEILQNKDMQISFFNKIFAEKVGDQRHSFKWMYAKLCDGKGNCSPRELIHLVNASIKAQAKHISLGKPFPEECLIGPEAIKTGLKEVSKKKLSILISEYPELSTYIHRLKRKNVRLTLSDLKEYWSINKREVSIISKKLFQLGFFKNESEDAENPKILIPELYRPAMGMN